MTWRIYAFRNGNTDMKFDANSEEYAWELMAEMAAMFGGTVANWTLIG